MSIEVGGHVEPGFEGANTGKMLVRL